MVRKTKGGRPVRRNQDIDTERQYARVGFVCTHEQKGRYVRVAGEGGMSLSAWLVGVADRECGRVNGVGNKEERTMK